MFFKNLMVYQFMDAINLVLLVKHLSEYVFKPLDKNDDYRMGFVSPVPGGEMLYHTVGNCTLFCAKEATRKVPAKAVQEEVDKRVKKAEAQGYQVSSREKRQIKSDIIFENLPKQLPSSRLIYFYIDVEAGLLVIDTTSNKVAEEITSKLRDILGSFPVACLAYKSQPSAILTHWLQQGDAPLPFEMQNSCKMRNIDDSGFIKFKDQYLSCEEVANHLATGLQVCEMDVMWSERLTCNVTETAIKKLKFLDVVKVEVDEADPETVAELLDTEFAIMSLEIRKMLNDLAEAMDGYSEPPCSFLGL